MRNDALEVYSLVLSNDSADAARSTECFCRFVASRRITLWFGAPASHSKEGTIGGAMIMRRSS